MEQLKVDIPEGQLQFFKNLINKLGYDYTVVDENIQEIPKKQQDIVAERIKNTPKVDYLSQKEFESRLNLDS